LAFIFSHFGHVVDPQQHLLGYWLLVMERIKKKDNSAAV